MSAKSIILVGGPDSGKSNYLARLWLGLQSRKHNLISTTAPEDIKYIEEIAAHILQGKFAPRTEPEDIKREFNVSVQSIDENVSAEIVVPDIYGEIWKKAVKTLEIPEKWLKSLRESTGAVLFVRILSPSNVEPLDWVASQGLLKIGLVNNDQNNDVPTQVALIELLRFLEENILRNGKILPKISVVVTAWDLLHNEEAQESPEAYLQKQFPMFAGRLRDTQMLDVKIFGCSIVGGDFITEGFTEQFLLKNIEESGYVVTKNNQGQPIRIDDITEPIKWLLH